MLTMKQKVPYKDNFWQKMRKFWDFEAENGQSESKCGEFMCQKWDGGSRVAGGVPPQLDEWLIHARTRQVEALHARYAARVAQLRDNYSAQTEALRDRYTLRRQRFRTNCQVL